MSGSLPEGTQFFIADGAGDAANMVLVEGFDDIGQLGLSYELVDSTVLSDTSKRHVVSKRASESERDLICRYEPDDEGQKQIIAAGKAGDRRKCQIQLPGALAKWEFTALFVKAVMQKPEAGKAMMLLAKVAIETETAGAI